MKDNEISSNDLPHKHPIVNRPKRPDWLFDDTHPTKMDWPSRRRQARRYIEWMEKERERLEAAIRQKDNALEVCEARRWEAEERIEFLDGELALCKASKGPFKKIKGIENVR